MAWRVPSDIEVLQSIGNKIKGIDGELTLKDLVKYYGEDFPVCVFINSNLTPLQQEALGIVGTERRGNKVWQPRLKEGGNNYE